MSLTFNSSLLYLLASNLLLANSRRLTRVQELRAQRATDHGPQYRYHLCSTDQLSSLRIWHSYYSICLDPILCGQPCQPSITATFYLRHSVGCFGEVGSTQQPLTGYSCLDRHKSAGTQTIFLAWHRFGTVTGTLTTSTYLPGSLQITKRSNGLRLRPW